VLSAAVLATASGLFSSEPLAFSGLVSPARFELKAKPGQVLTNVLEIGNDAPEADEFLVSTSDWNINTQGGVEFNVALKTDSCRPWVRIERRSLKMAPRGMRKFRFEIHVPPDAPAQECRFAVVIEKAPENLPSVSAGTIQFPLQGRIGVIVYVAVGEISPKLELRTVGMTSINGNPTVGATFFNGGSAHGRPEGILEGTDASGKKIDFTVSPFPILPGETRTVAIWPQDEANGKSPAIAYPLRLRGTIEWEGGKGAVDATVR
jgi:fimbrial chaperone protein